VDDKREGTGTAPDSVQRIIADLEAIDGRLASHRAAHPAPASTLPIDKTRVLLRDAIKALAPAASSETGEEAGSTKRRVKIKAESGIAPPEEGADAKDASKPTGSAKSAARGKDGARNGRRPATTDKTPTVSLIARLGAATENTAPPQAPPPTQAAPPAEISTPVTAGDSLKATADRLAQLEAEIADLTEAVTAAPTKTADDAAPPNEAAGGTVGRLDPSGVGDDQEDDAEFTIVAAHGAPRESATRAARHSPRILRDEPLPEEEEAEVEIRGSDVAATVRGRPTGTRSTTRARESMAKGGQLGKWRIFRGSS
jgi:hypothetical protein